jgi:hypothetical protein
MQTNRLSTSAIKIFEKNLHKFESTPLASKSILLADPPKGFEGFFNKDGKKKEDSKFKFPDFGGGDDKSDGSGQNSDEKKYDLLNYIIYKIHFLFYTSGF